MSLLTGRRLPAASVAVAAALTLTLSACGGTDQPEVASAATASGQATPAATGGVIEQYVEARRAYVACMRENGVDLPDPGPKGQIDFGDGRARKSDPVFRNASKTCTDFNPTVPAELEEKGPPLTEEQIVNNRRYAACVRANGVPEFRDPGPDGYFTDENGQPTSEQGAAAMFRAGQICEPVLAGRPSTTPNPAATGQG